MRTPTISIYNKIDQTTGNAVTAVDQFLNDVQDGKWEDQVLKVRSLKAQNKPYKNAKEQLPYVTISGIFSTRANSGLIEHSGFLCIDIDKLGDKVLETKDMLSQDPYFYALFLSCSGSGLCGLVKINPKSHRECFDFMSEYMFNTYGINIDEQCKDVSRPRYVSYDPDVYLNNESQLSGHKPRPKKEIQPKRYFFLDEDFKRILTDIDSLSLDLTADYNDWIYCGFAFADKFGEDGREFFHQISENHPDYDYDKTDYKYTHLLNSKTGSISIDWFYHIIEKNGLTPYGKGTQEFMQTAVAQQRAWEAGLIDDRPLAAAQIVGMEIPAYDPAIQVKNFLHAGYKIAKNDMTGELFVGDEALTDEILNTVYILCRSKIDKVGSRELVYQVLDSRFTPRFHPVRDIIKKYEDNPPLNPTGHISALIGSLHTETAYATDFIKKWLVGIIATIHGHHSPLMLILQGPQNIGKTGWFRGILPLSLTDYYAETKMDEGKDDLILMSKKLILVNDEMSGQTMQEEKKLKSITSKDKIDLRVPFGRTHSSLKRLAMLGGTANEEELVSDPTGERRKIPVAIDSINFDVYNAVDKELFIFELWNEYYDGFNYELNAADIELLSIAGEQFKKTVAEEDLLAFYFSRPQDLPDRDVNEMSSTEIFDFLKQRTRAQISPVTLGKYLKKLGFDQVHRRVGKTTIRKYMVVVIEEIFNK